MRYRLLGRTGVRVSEYMLGTMSYGSDGNTDERECINIVHAALDRGINFIDTADTYSHGEAEQIVGKAIVGRRDKDRSRHEISSACRRWPKRARWIALLDHDAGREQPAASRNGPHRSLSDAPPGSTNRSRRNA